MARRRPLVTFFLLAYALSWPFAFAISIFGAPLETSAILAFAPMVAALITHHLSGESGPAFRWTSTVPRTILVSILCVALVWLAFIIVPALLLSQDPRRLNWTVFFAAQSYNWSTLLGGPFGEEPGWRGYALPRMQSRFGPLRGTLLLGLLWTCWHLPLFVSDKWPHPPFYIYLPLVLSLTVLLSFSTNQARYAVIPAILGHAAFNSTGTYFAGLFAQESMSADNAFWAAITTLMKRLGLPPMHMSPNALIVACGIAVALAIILATRGRLASTRATLPACQNKPKPI